MSEIAEKVKAIIIDKLGVEESEVTPVASFTNDLYPGNRHPDRW
jgi:acyl carrier protein